MTGKGMSPRMLRREFASVRQQTVLGMSYTANRKVLQPALGPSALIFTRRHAKGSSSGPTPAVTKAATSTPTDSTPSKAAISTATPTPVPTGPAPTISDDTYNHVNPATSTPDAVFQYCISSLVGLFLCRPTLYVQVTMEVFHNTIHLPWFWTIVAGTAFWRLLVLPVSIRGLRNTSRLRSYLPDIQKLQAGVNDAIQKKDPTLQQKAVRKLNDMYNKAGVTGDGSWVAIMQVPITLGTHFAVMRMCNLPRQPMKLSGVDFIPDLTVADPTWVLPVIWTILVNIQIPLGAAEMDLKTRPVGAHLMNGLRILSILAIGVTATFPAGLFVSFITRSAFSIVQSTALRFKPLRKSLGTQVIPEEAGLPTMKETLKWAFRGRKDKDTKKD